ncbi:MAG: Asp-tRNA(Asn)/Glu-tRNA(Gln) amidotransferase subunit GatB [Planctomycetota bacterium]|nr:Asp-tRNA(Asn)/Glu-tRNA(Gln) amidotransferase subunit GatB [Planctomycetota bacterium]
MTSAAAVDFSTWETIVGLEVHAQLKTRTKLYCGCRTVFGDPPNTHVCPVCLGLPGSLPVLNETAFEMALKAALALGCGLAPFTKWDRKNYYYPDLPKNYQISQYDLPFATRGKLEIDLDGARKTIGITRVHLEEDAGKLVHDAHARGSGVDLNRAGTPLIEIVSEPDLRTPAEARAYMEALARILEYLDVCDCNMQEGSLRCDANVSIRPRGQQAFNTRREIKNMNSFRFVEQAIVQEVEDQKRIYAEGGKVVQSTRLFNGQTGEIRTMRTKEEASDYRYFPEPDLPPVTLSEAQIERVRATIEELPEARFERYTKRMGLPEKDARTLVDYRAQGAYFDALVKAGIEPKPAANWVISDSQGVLKERGVSLDACGVTPGQCAELLKLVEQGALNRATAKEKVFPAMLDAKGAKHAAAIVQEQGLAQVSDTGAIERAVAEVLKAEQKLVADYVAGKDAVVNALFGRCMKALKGQGNPQVLRPLLESKLQALRAKN